MSKHHLLILFAVGLGLATTAVSAFSQNQQRIHRSSTRLHAENPPKLNVAVVGAGPSGLLLSHLLLKQENVRVTILEGRSDPRQKGTEQRAYALGIGIRGRTAIRQVDEVLWQAVKQRGFESERFQLHLGSLVIPLRSERDGGNGVEPSLLTFQSELCAALAEELERRHQSSGRLELSFDTKISDCDLETMKLETSTGEVKGAFDLIVGCDGVNSAVRSAIKSTFPAFETSKETLPGEFKVVRLDKVPPNVDPKSVSLLVPGGAFIEPTGEDGSCCILFSGRGENTLLSETKNKTAVLESLQASFPKWGDFHDEISSQLMAQQVTGSASSVVCNTYHYSDKAVLVGDAAHATGGVSGQGVNSALMDSVALADSLHVHRDNLSQALLEYSTKQVPEGKAIYDLSFGPKPKGLKGIVWTLRNARDTIIRGRFGIGKAPLQTRLTTETTSFAEIRRERDRFYETPFPSASEFQERLNSIHSAVGVASSESPTNV